MLPHYDTEGPFGVPMKDAQARALETRLKDLPKDDAFAFRRATLARGLAEWQPEGRADVSWITVPSRTTRARPPRRTTPCVTYEPAIVPSRETRNSCRTSTSPIVSSVVTGRSMPTSACSMSSVSW